MIKVRPARPIADEDAFVAMNWRLSCEHESRVAMLGPRPYARFMGRLIEELRTEEGAYTLIATDEEDEDLFLGFAVIKEPELHFVYVKHEFRKQGIAKLLLADRNIDRITTTTRKCVERLKPAERGWELRPRLTI